jgi:hypothetical protein
MLGKRDWRNGARNTDSWQDGVMDVGGEKLE